MDTTMTAAHGTHTTHGVPHGYATLTPFLAIPDAAAAIEFYTRVFGARLLARTDAPGPDGGMIVAHAELEFATGRLQLGDPNPAYGLIAQPGGNDQTCYSMGLYCPDVDAVLARAVAAGAMVREPATTFVSGDRYCSLLDPFGVRWSVLTRVDDLSDEESAARVAEWARTEFGG
ncbi:VOC family protein [Tomitella biformata]|uniref:VOC family protein n=1 Tax=Tomitella biformata TaxID=630403 RepID=UPI0004677BC3|nr:VOC family protein [Tomitella biformata]